jgi:Uma2 family endonuclease
VFSVRREYVQSGTAWPYNESMSTRSAEYVEAIEHLPPGATLVFRQVTWDQYEELLEGLADRPGLRVSYDEGKLEIVSLLPEHEEYKDSLYTFVRAFTEEYGITLETRGSATWKRRKLRKGTEPDACFYIANAEKIIGRRKIDLEFDPPPDIAVEIDTTHESLSKFPIYAALCVPEIWIYNGKHTKFYGLSHNSYKEIAASQFLPDLTSQLLTEFLDLSNTQGQTKALLEFRRRIRSRKSLR